MKIYFVTDAKLLSPNRAGIIDRLISYFVFRNDKVSDLGHYIKHGTADKERTNKWREETKYVDRDNIPL